MICKSDRAQVQSEIRNHTARMSSDIPVRMRRGNGACSSRALTTWMPKSLYHASKSSKSVITGGTTRYHKRSYASVFGEEKGLARAKDRIHVRTSIRCTHQRRTFPIPGCVFHTCPSYASWVAAYPPAARGSLRLVSTFSMG